MPRIVPEIYPPHEPWQPHQVTEPAVGCLSFFFSDELSPLAVREITRPHDNKSDPNIETGTYGLFSTCQRQMRTSIINRGIKYVFFVCNRNGLRAIAGYYRLAWYADGILHAKRLDYALAADKVHFVDPPIVLSTLPELVASAATRPFRLWKLLNDFETATLLGALDEKPNALDRYLSEIDRLERFQRYHSGYRYVSWQQEEPFTWQVAEQYLVTMEESARLGNVLNSSPSGFWRCRECTNFVGNKALLKKCPHCGAMGALYPVSEVESVSEEN